MYDVLLLIHLIRSSLNGSKAVDTELRSKINVKLKVVWLVTPDWAGKNDHPSEYDLLLRKDALKK